jgi:phosphatidylglycerol:prolipoprotein diacylglycerol transferase
MLRHLTRKYERNLIKWLDVFVPTIILGLAFFHLGAFFDGTNYGLPTELPWGIVFENYEIKYIGAIHPSQIYALLYSLLTFILLYFINSTKKIQEYPKPGFIATLGVAAYSLFYFLEQFTRGDDTMTIFGDVRVPQIFAFAIFVFATYKLYKNYKTVLRSEQ